jgi:hypothetical protein
MLQAPSLVTPFHVFEKKWTRHRVRIFSSELSDDVVFKAEVRQRVLKSGLLGTFKDLVPKDLYIVFDTVIK